MQAKEVSPFQEGLAQETHIQETVGSLIPGLAGLLTSPQLTHMVHHLGLAPHMLPTVGIPMQRQAGSHMHLTSHPLTHLSMVRRKVEQFHLGRRNSQHLAEGRSTAVTHTLHCSETHATDNCTPYMEGCSSLFLSAFAVGFIRPLELIRATTFVLHMHWQWLLVFCVHLTAAFCPDVTFWIYGFVVFSVFD